MTINQLRYFCAVCKQNNISKAAEELYVSQPAVSVALKELEEELQEKLFVRRNNKLFLTESGNRLWEMSEDLLSHMLMIENSFKEKNEKAEKLRIGIFPDLAKWAISYMADLNQKLSEKYHNLDVELIEISPTDRNRALLNHTIDVVFSNDDNELLSVFGMKKVYRTQMMVCMNENHLLAKEKTISMEMLKNENIIGNYYDMEKWCDWLSGLCEENETVPQTKYFFLQNAAVHILLKQNKGVCFSRPEVNGMSMEGIVAIPLQKAYYVNIVMMYDNRYTIRDIVADLLELAKPVSSRKGI